MAKIKATIPEKEKKKKLFNKLKKANSNFQKLYPGDRPERQPVHTVYGGANLFKYNSAKVLGERALETFQAYAPDFISFGKIFGLQGITELPEKDFAAIRSSYESLTAADKKKHPAHLSYDVYNKVIAKLRAEAIEDFRIDFEDGYGNRVMKKKMERLPMLQGR